MLDMCSDNEVKCYEEIKVNKRDNKALEKEEVRQKKAELDKHVIKKGFRMNAKTFFFTYPKCDIKPVEALETLVQIFEGYGA